MDTMVLLKVAGYAVIPLVMSLMGNNLAAEVVIDKSKRRWYRVGFFVLLFWGY